MAFVGLTAIKSPEEAWERHINDSLSLLPVMEACLHGNAKSTRIVDVGDSSCRQKAVQSLRNIGIHTSNTKLRKNMLPGVLSPYYFHAWDEFYVLFFIKNTIKEPNPVPNSIFFMMRLRFLQVGSGAGLPGLIIAIARPDWQVCSLQNFQAVSQAIACSCTCSA